MVFERVTVPELNDADLVADGFAGIARDGAANIDVATRVQKLLAIVATNGDGAMRDEARRQAAIALQRSRIVMSLEHDKQTLARLHDELHTA